MYKTRCPFWVGGSVRAVGGLVLPKTLLVLLFRRRSWWAAVSDNRVVIRFGRRKRRSRLLETNSRTTAAPLNLLEDSLVGCCRTVPQAKVHSTTGPEAAQGSYESKQASVSMSALFSPDSLLGRYEGLLGERSSLENKIKNLEAELRQVRAAATMSRSSREGQDELDVLLHSFDGSEVFVGRTGSGSPSKQRGVKRGDSNTSKTRSSSTGLACGTPVDSAQSGWTSVDTFMSTETTLCDSEGFASKDSLESFPERKSSTPSHVKQTSGLQSGTFFSSLDSRGEGGREGSNNGRNGTGASGNMSSSGIDRLDTTAGMSWGVISCPQENWSLMENRTGSNIVGGGGGGGGGYFSTGAGSGGPMEQNTSDGHVVFDGDDAPSRLSVMSDGQISKLIGDRDVARFSVLSESQMSKLLGTGSSVHTPARFLGSPARVPKSTKSGKRGALSGKRGASSDGSGMGRCFSLDSTGGSVGSMMKSLRGAPKSGCLTSGGGLATSLSSVSSLHDTGSLLSDGRMDSKTSLDLLCKEMMKGIDEMKSMSQAISRRKSIHASTHSTGDLERASTMPLSSCSSAILLSNSDEMATTQEVPPLCKSSSRMANTDPDIPAFLTREMQPFTKDSCRETRVLSPVMRSPEPERRVVVSAPPTQECFSRDIQALAGDLTGSYGKGNGGGPPAGMIAGAMSSGAPFPACLTREMQPFDSRAGKIKTRPPSLGSGAELLQRNVAQESLVVPEEDNFSKEFCMVESIKKRPRTDAKFGYKEGSSTKEDWNGLPSCLDREMEKFHSSGDDDVAVQEVGWVESQIFNNEFGEEDSVQKRPPRPRTPLPLQFLRSLGQKPKGGPSEFRTFRNLCEAVYSGGRTSPSDEEIVGAVQGEVNRVLMESPELGSEGGLVDMVESVTKELGTRSLQRRLLSPVLEELSHRSNNIDSVEDPPGEDCARRAVVGRGIRSPFADYLSDSVADDDDVEFWTPSLGNPVNHQGFGSRESVSRPTTRPPPKLIECCFSSAVRSNGVMLSRRATIAASRSETTLTDFVVSQAIVSSGTVQFDICCEKLEGWAFVGILAASAMDNVRPRSLAESSTAYGWTSDSEFFEGGTYHFEAQKEMIAPGASFQLVVDCTRGMVSLKVPQVSPHGAKHQCHKRYLVCEMEDLPPGEWRLAIEWLGTAKFELLDVKRWV